MDVFPKDYKSPNIRVSGKRSMVKVPEAQVAVVILFIILILTLAAWGGLWLYNKKLIEKEADLNEQIKAEREKRDQDLQKKIVNLYYSLDNFQSVLNSHVYSSEVFGLIEELTLPDVQWLSFSLDTNTNIINLEGRTRSYSLLAEQLTAFKEDSQREKSPRIKDVEMGSQVSLGEDGVSFSVKLEILPHTLRKD